MKNPIKSTLTNKKKLNTYCQSLSIEEIEVYISNLTHALEVRKEEERIKAEEEREKKEKLNSVKQILADEGLGIEDLITALEDETKKKPRRTAPAKYRYVQDGKEKTWTGQGRTPAVIDQAIANGGSLEDFLIERQTS